MTCFLVGLFRNLFRINIEKIDASKSSSKLHALIIGIDKYPNVRKLAGAVRDADAISDFLTNHLGVPLDQITNLRDHQATRSAIKSNIDSFATNSMIQRGDPILIYFAGHGGLAEASPKWKERNGSDHLQVIFPWDYNMGDHQTQKAIHPIPDRTIRGLVNKIAEAKGNNITLIFDSCYSASSSRNGQGMKPLSSSRLSRAAEVEFEIPYDLDDDLVPSRISRLLGNRNSRGPTPSLYTDQASHVLLAACGPHDKAWEENGRGVFTVALIDAMQRHCVNKLTYQNLITGLPQMASQSPHTYGIHKSRILFDSRVSSQQTTLIPVKWCTSSGWILEAGESSGVSLGSIWEIYTIPSLKATPVGTLCACFLKPSCAHLDSTDMAQLSSIPDGTTLLYARQIEAGGECELKVYFTLEANKILHPRKYAHRAVFNQTKGDKNSKNELRYIIEGDRQNADIVVGVHRRNAKSELVMSTRQTDSERYNVPLFKHSFKADRNEFDTAIGRASHWNWHLQYTNPSQLEPPISVNFVKLRETQGKSSILVPKPWQNLNEGGFVKIQVRPQDEYGIIITSNDVVPLHVCVFFFNASDFSILNIGDSTSATGKQDPVLGPKGCYCIGSTGEGGAPIGFGLTEPDKAEVGYIKVVWSTDELKLNYLGDARAVSVGRPRNPRIRWGTIAIEVLQLP